MHSAFEIDFSLFRWHGHNILGKGLHISSGHEVAARSLEHNTAHFRVVFDFVDRIEHRVTHIQRQSIEHFGTVHRERRNAILMVNEQVKVVGRVPNLDELKKLIGG